MNPNNLLQEYLTSSAKKFSHKTAFIQGKDKISYRCANEWTDAIAQQLIAMKLLPGDRVVIGLGNDLATILLFWAVIKAGGVIVVIDHALSSNEMSQIIQDAQPRFVGLTTDMFVKINLKDFADVQSITLNTSFKSLLTIAFAQLEFKGPMLPNISSLACIIYTSGSTGTPKGVMLSHDNMLAASESINSYLKHSSDDVFLSVLPLSFDYGLYQMILSVQVGATFILEKNFLLPLQILKQISIHRVTIFPGVPTIFYLLYEYAKKFAFDLSSVRIVTNTGAEIASEHINIIKTLFAEANFFSMYGLTECKRCTYLPPKDLGHKQGSVGIPIPNTKMWIIDDDQKGLAPFQLGQIVVQGPTLMQGYWNKPLATKQKISMLDGHKTLLTGDLGYVDHDGYFYLRGRMDDTIKIKGLKVNPFVIQQLIANIEEVKEVAVAALKDDMCGYILVAYVVLHHDSTLTNKRLQILYSQLPESINVILKFVILQALPKTSNGKVDRARLSTHLPVHGELC